jgi:Spy/CpxP family protein refolding chaperone
MLKWNFHLRRAFNLMGGSTLRVRACVPRLAPELVPLRLSKRDYSMRRIKTPAALLVAVFALTLAGPTLAQPPGGGPLLGGGPPGGPGGFFGGGGIAGILQMPEVQKEIELSDDQKAELGKLRTEIRDQIRNQMQDSFNGMRDLSEEERQARVDQIRTQMDAIRKDVEGKLQKVLLPNQFDRLKQIDLQSRIQREGAGALTSGELADQLGLTDAQREQLQQKSEDVQKDLQAKIRQARIDARNQLLDVLTPEQRAKLDALMGTQFDLPEPNFNPNGGQPGNRGAGGRLGRNGLGRNAGGARSTDGGSTPTPPPATSPPATDGSAN